MVKMNTRPSEISTLRQLASSAPMAVLGLLLLLCPIASSQAQEKPIEEKKIGRTLRLTLPITGRTFDRAQRFVRKTIEQYQAEGTRLVLVFEFYVPPDQVELARTSKFGAAYDMADFLTSEELNKVRTVAYIPQPIEGHAVLVAAACQEIHMAKDAALGLAGAAEKAIDDQYRRAYKKIANLNKNIPDEIALWMLEPSHEVLLVPTDAGRKYVAPGDLEELEKHFSIDKNKIRKLFDPLDPAHSIASVSGMIRGEEAAKEHLFKSLYLANSRADAAHALELPLEDLDEDPGLVGEWRAVRIDLKGPMSEDKASQVEKLIEAQIREDKNFICLWIDSPGGSLAASQRLAYYLGSLDASKVRTRAYVPVQARSDAALVALACNQAVMLPQAELGGPGAQEFTQEELADAERAIRDEASPWKAHPWPLVAAMIDRQMTVYCCTRPGEVKYLSEKEIGLEEQQHPEVKWNKERITRLDKPPFSGQEAVKYDLAALTVEDFAEFKQHYVLENDPSLVEPAWSSFLIEALTSRGAAFFLLVIGFAALYVELHVPGVGIGGFVATVCFALFFWSRFLGGTAGWLSVTLFAAGICCLLLEFFILPGFGIFGLGGGILVLASLVLASQTFVLPHNPYQWGQLQRSLLTIAAAFIGFTAVASVLRKWLPRAPIVNQVLLEPPSGEEAETISRREAMVDLHDLVGRRGVTATQLTPSGKARFGNRLVDVMTEGDLVPRGTEIEVVEVRGSRVIVKTPDGK
jgi:membrane-bound serine protease (ClpP class)